VKKNEKLN
jgi:hypothetical protein